MLKFLDSPVIAVSPSDAKNSAVAAISDGSSKRLNIPFEIIKKVTHIASHSAANPVDTAIRKADKSALAYEKIGNLTLNEQRSAQWGKFIFFSVGQDLGARH